MALDEEIEQFITRPIPYEVPHEARCHARAERHGAALGFLLSELAYLIEPDRPAPSQSHLAGLVRQAIAFGHGRRGDRPRCAATPDAARRLNMHHRCPHRPP